MDNWSRKKKDCYHDFLEQMIKDGYIEENPKRWVRPKYDDVYDYFYKTMKGTKNPSKVSVDQEVQEWASNFYNYWDDLDWKRGKTRMKSWKGSANTWIKNQKKFNKKGMPKDIRELEQWAIDNGGRRPRPGESEYEYRAYCQTLNDD